MIAPSISRQGFVAATAVFFLPSLPIGVLLALFAPVPPPPVGLDGTLQGGLRTLLDACVIAPVLETLVLMFTSSLAGQAIRVHAVACVVGALPVVLMHGHQGWLKIIAVVWPFIWAAHCNLRLADQGAPARTRFLFLTAMHATMNGLLLAFVIAMRSLAPPA